MKGKDVSLIINDPAGLRITMNEIYDRFCRALNIKFLALMFQTKMDSSVIVNVDFASIFP